MKTKTQVKNLLKLADYLSSGKLKAKFDMWNFGESGHYSHGQSCGSVGCAVGHAPFAGIKIRKREGWCDFSSRTLIDSRTIEWEWCFSSRWKYYDNSPIGASKRIYWLLIRGVPHEFLGDEFSTPYKRHSLAKLKAEALSKQ